MLLNVEFTRLKAELLDWFVILTWTFCPKYQISSHRKTVYWHSGKKIQKGNHLVLGLEFSVINIVAIINLLPAYIACTCIVTERESFLFSSYNYM